MRGALATTVLTVVLAVAVLAAGAAVPRAGAATNPSPAQVRAAIARAEKTTTLWATVNICDTRAYPNVLGIRGQMPSLGFPAWLSMQIGLRYYSATRKRFVTDPGTAKTIRLGRSTHGLQQGGATYTFKGATPVLQASVRFIWRRSGRLLGSTAALTTAGHPSADYGSPPRFSAATCRIR